NSVPGPHHPPDPAFHTTALPHRGSTSRPGQRPDRITSAPQASKPPRTCDCKRFATGTFVLWLWAPPGLPGAPGAPEKGGDPAAPSGTATLLRLRPNRWPHLRRLPPRRVRPPASGVANFRDVTGGVYKARERIHRDVADSRLLATPTSWGRVADPNPN